MINKSTLMQTDENIFYTAVNYNNQNNQRSKSSHLFDETEDNNTGPTNLVRQNKVPSVQCNHDQQLQLDPSKGVIHTEDHRIALMRDNARFLKKKIMPLSDQNEQLKHHVLGLTYYIEQSRLDFVSLLRQSDRNGGSRVLEKSIGDLVCVYHALKDDLQEDALQEQQYTDKIQELNALVESNTIYYETTYKELTTQFDEKQDSLKAELKVKQDNFNEIFKKSEMFKLTINDLKRMNIQHVQLHQAELLEQQKSIDHNLHQIQVVKEQYKTQIQQIQESHVFEINKQATLHKTHLNDIKNECDDKILKNEQKGKRLQSDQKGLKAEYQEIQTQLNQAVQKEEKLNQKFANQLNENKRIRDQMNLAKQQMEKAESKLLELTQRFIKQNQERIHTDAKIQQQMEQLKLQEDSYRILLDQKKLVDLMIQEKEDLKNAQLNELSSQFSNQEICWRRKLANQQSKYEAILNVQKNQNKIQAIQKNVLIVNKINIIDKENNESLSVINEDLKDLHSQDELQSQFEDSKNQHSQDEQQSQFELQSQFDDLYETKDFGCQKDDTVFFNLFKVLEKSNEELSSDLHQRTQNENSFQTKLRNEFQQRKQLLRKETQVQLQDQAEKFEKEQEYRIQNLKTINIQEQEQLQIQIEKVQQEYSAIEFILERKINLLEDDKKKLSQESRIDTDHIVQLKYSLQEQIEFVKEEKSQNILNLELQKNLSDSKQETAKNYHEFVKKDLEQKNDSCQKQIVETNKQLIETIQQKKELNDDVKQLQKQKTQTDKQAQDWEKIMLQQNDVIKHLSMEIEHSKKVYNIFKNQDIIKHPNTISRTTNVLEFDEQMIKGEFLNRSQKNTIVAKEYGRMKVRGRDHSQLSSIESNRRDFDNREMKIKKKEQDSLPGITNISQQNQVLNNSRSKITEKSLDEKLFRKASDFQQIK